MYNPSAVNEIANWIVLAASIPASVAALAFSFLSPWYRTWLGFIVWGWLVSIASVLIFVFSRRMWGDYFGYEWAAVAVYTSFAFFTTAFLLIFFVERRHADLLELPLNHNSTTGGVDVIERKSDGD